MSNIHLSISSSIIDSCNMKYLESRKLALNLSYPGGYGYQARTNEKYLKDTTTGQGHK